MSSFNTDRESAKESSLGAGKQESRAILLLDHLDAGVMELANVFADDAHSDF